LLLLLFWMNNGFGIPKKIQCTHVTANTRRSRDQMAIFQSTLPKIDWHITAENKTKNVVLTATRT